MAGAGAARGGPFGPGLAVDRGRGNDAVRFHIDASRSAQAAAKLFGDLAPETVIVCDRYSAYKRLARLLGGTVVLAFC